MYPPAPGSARDERAERRWMSLVIREAQRPPARTAIRSGRSRVTPNVTRDEAAASRRCPQPARDHDHAGNPCGDEVSERSPCCPFLHGDQAIWARSSQRGRIMTTTIRVGAAVALAGLLVGCGGAQGTAPEDMSAAGHRDAARAHEEQGDRAGVRVSRGSPRLGGTESRIDLGAPHRDESRDHAAAAEALEARRIAACEEVPDDEQAPCPLAAHWQSASDVTGGVEIRLSDAAGSAEEVQHRIDCHRARMAVTGFAGSPRCPLGVLGLAVRATPAEGGGVSVRLTAPDEESAGQLRARAHAMRR